MTDRDPHVTLVRLDGSEEREQTQLPHEQLDVYDVLEDAYRTTMSWQGVSWAKGTTGDQLKRSASSAVLRYTEGYYADGGNKASLWKGARASCGRPQRPFSCWCSTARCPKTKLRAFAGYSVVP